MTDHSHLRVVRAAFRYLRGLATDRQLLDQFFTSIEHSTFRMWVTPHGSQGAGSLFHDMLKVGKAYVHVYSTDIPASVRVVWSKSGAVHEQLIRLPSHWYIAPERDTETRRVVPWEVNAGAAIVIVMNSLDSGNVNVYYPACFRLVGQRWRLANPRSRGYEFDDFGDCFFKGDHLYIYNGDGGGNTKMDPQKFILRDYRWRNCELRLSSVRQTIRDYVPLSKSDPLVEFGLRRASWRGRRPRW
jgi:hypothetical protein